MNLNYTFICWYCGSIYKANRSTSKYCSRKHNSLYAANGSQIDYSVFNSRGEHVSYNDILRNLYDEIGDFHSWSLPCSHHKVIYNYDYKGPLPKADELLFVSGFLIRRHFINKNLYLFKPMEMLTKQEKASGKIVNVGFYYLIGDY